MSTDPSTRTAAAPPWAQVHLLGVLAQSHSFTRAAERLGLSKAAVSQRVADLERAVGVPLVARTTRSVRLTPAGQQLVDETAASFAQIEQSLHGVRDLAAQPHGLVRVTAPVAFGRQQLAPRLGGFLRAWPKIRIELELSDRFVNLPHEGFDLAVRHVSQPPEQHVAWKLCATRTVLVASAAYLKRRGRPLHPAELSGHDCLPYLRQGAAVWPFEQIKPVRGAEPERLRVAVAGPLRANNSEVLREALLAGLGIGLLPDFSVGSALASGKLVELLPGWRPHGFFGDAIHALRPSAPRVPKAVRALVAHLRESLAGGFDG
ncbi:MAG TPA: LysR substrate-binding domain-containing protein [Methylibium sp.]|uniref:LysR family transcriptional regulator n=1 Tax=Methylibium sp. TaxID=2067992 RepID=UPI002DBB56FF|nr:LysR substrate-binding domain-containing protein [Methylibium sp.]HEU4460538.1 LysR substrate-binding domain-containing protein [Methylibium sp.]